ncbi:MAG: glycosyltransferase [Chthoniobacterales bacterium]|nr:glycosyltransferase [Chthoniobacterales bacterium]
MKIAWFATKGRGSNEAQRMQALVSLLPDTTELPFDKADKRQSFFQLWAAIKREKPDLLVMEGTGIAGGAACLLARMVYGIRYVVSSGDAVGPFVRALHPVLGIFFEIYERWLCRWSAGFIGWTPYLCGRAMAFGAKKTVTAEGWVIGSKEASVSRDAIRSAWGVPPGALVVGIVGSLSWNPRRQWCYGLDLVRAAHKVERPDLCVVIVGGGDGLPRLKQLAGSLLGRRIFLPGPVPLEEVMSNLQAMDVGSLPQSVDGVGTYRYTTKLPEYLAARLPVITNQIPMAYDLGLDGMWRLPGDSPWDKTHQEALEELLRGLDKKAIRKKADAMPSCGETHFSKEQQIARVAAFLREVLQEGGRL